MKKVQLIECPRDAMQSWSRLIPAEEKIGYHQVLLKAGFHTLDFGSFVSRTAIPQMADTAEVLDALDLSTSRTHLLAIVANVRGAEQAAASEKVRYLGFPFSVSEIFQRKNTNAGREEAFERLKTMQQICVAAGKELVVYLSMGFGNPYGEDYGPELVSEWSGRIAGTGVKILAVSDTVGLASSELVHRVTQTLVKELPEVNIGVHLHAAPDHWKPKVEAALDAGCLRFDAAMKGWGGCPLSGSDLVGNLPMERLVDFLEENGFDTGIDHAVLEEAVAMAGNIFIQ